MLNNTLLSHESTDEDLWMAVKAGRSCDSDNIVDVVCPNFIHTTCSQSMQSVF